MDIQFSENFENGIGIDQNFENNIFEKNTEEQISETIAQDDENLESADSSSGSNMTSTEKLTSQTRVKSYQYNP